jgi:hypothetical protein
MDDLARYIKEFKDKLFSKNFSQVGDVLERRDSAPLVVARLQRRIPPLRSGTATNLEIWELCGQFYRGLGRFHEALLVFQSLYEQLLKFQSKSEKWISKGMPLVWISECHKALSHPVVAKRYLMLTACEDAIRESGKISPETTGVYFRAVWLSGLSHNELSRYAQEFWQIYKRDPVNGRYPEWVLQRIGHEWMAEYPSAAEASYYFINRIYADHLLRKNRQDGTALEHLAHYLLGAMPGCRAYMRQRSPSTDYDIICAMEGGTLDFRDELGRYFVCECKDWSKPADFSSFAKFCRVLDSVKCRFGILFSKNGISGHGHGINAEREQLKVFQDRGLVIVVISNHDLVRIVSGANFLTLLRSKYEEVRLDLKKKLV